MFKACNLWGREGGGGRGTIQIDKSDGVKETPRSEATIKIRHIHFVIRPGFDREEYT